jgi:hypothetical protein
MSGLCASQFRVGCCKSYMKHKKEPRRQVRLGFESVRRYG